MKVTVNIDCTPEEARAFLGLPDVAPMQKAMMEQMKERMQSSLAAMDPETMVKTWFPVSVQNLEQMQRMFWQQMASGSSGWGGGAGRGSRDDSNS